MKICIIFFGIFSFSPLIAQEADSRWSSRIDSIMESNIDDNSPGLAIGIVRNGSVMYEEYLGLSNLEHKIAIDRNSRFNIASNAKQYTALCILTLIEKGLLDLNDDITKYLPHFYQDSSQTISITNLLNHSSGIRDVYDLWSLQGKTWWEIPELSNSDALALLEKQNSLNFQPGTDYLYSNSNYILLTQIIKNISGQPFREFSKSLFDTIGMTKTSFSNDYMAIIPNKARPYANWGSWKEYPAVTNLHGDGSLYTTLSDQIKWEQMVHNILAQDNHQEAIKQSQELITGSNIENYGYGLMFGDYKGLDYTYHDGSTGAYNATFFRFPTERTSIIVLSNSGTVSTNSLARQVADLIFKSKDLRTYAYPERPEKIDFSISADEMLGTYFTSEGTVIKIIQKEGSLFREIDGREPVKLNNDEGGLYTYDSNKDLKISFSRDDDKNVIFEIYYPFQEVIPASKIAIEEVDQAYLKSIEGDFYNSETNTKISIAHDAEKIFILTKNGRTRTSTLIGKDFLTMNSYKIRIRRDRMGEISGLIIDNNRIKNVFFSKEMAGFDIASIAGVYTIDLRPGPSSAPYLKNFIISEISEKTFSGEFYDTSFSNGKLNNEWGTIYFTFTTNDQNNSYYHSGSIVGNKVQGITYSPERDFTMPWFGEKKK